MLSRVGVCLTDSVGWVNQAGDLDGRLRGKRAESRSNVEDSAFSCVGADVCAETGLLSCFLDYLTHYCSC